MMSHANSDYSLHPASPSDEPFLRLLYATTRQDEMPLRLWSKAHRDKFLALQFEAQSESYRQSYPQAVRSLVVVGRKPVGQLLLDERENDMRVVDISLLPGFRNHGIGSVVLRQVIAEAACKGKSTSLHVLRGSPAIRLYERLGFRERDSAAPGRIYLVKELAAEEERSESAAG